MMKYEDPNIEILLFSEQDIRTNVGVSEVGEGEKVETDDLGWW